MFIERRVVKWLVACALLLMPLAASASGNGQPHLELLFGVPGGSGTSAYTQTLSKFVYPSSSMFPSVPVTYRGSLIWPLTKHLDIVMNVENIERQSFQGFDWNVSGLSGALRGTLELGFDGLLFLQAGFGPTLSRTVLNKGQAGTFVENHLGKYLSIVSGATFYFSRSFGVTLSATRHQAWVMENRFGDRHDIATWNGMLGIAWRMDGDKQ